MPTSPPFLHLEISSKCSLKCAYCPRTQHPNQYNVRDMDLAVLKNIVDIDKIYESVLLCGAHGDPIYHSQFHEVIGLLRQLKGSPWINMATNGSHRKEEWWVRTAQVFEKKDIVIFGVDGLEDTNHLHRKNSDWKSIMTAMKTLRRHSSCSMRWQWILFRHNQHQLREAKAMALDMGMEAFFIVESLRGVGDDEPTISLQEAQEMIL